jgi:hypothetical protein
MALFFAPRFQGCFFKENRVGCRQQSKEQATRDDPQRSWGSKRPTCQERALNGHSRARLSCIRLGFEHMQLARGTVCGATKSLGLRCPDSLCAELQRHAPENAHEHLTHLSSPNTYISRRLFKVPEHPLPRLAALLSPATLKTATSMSARTPDFSWHR